MTEADLIIVCIGQDNFQIDQDGGIDLQGFSDSRLAGVLRKSPDANYIFTVQVLSHQTEIGPRLCRKLHQELEDIVSSEFKLVHGPTLHEIFGQVRDFTVSKLY